MADWSRVRSKAREFHYCLTEQIRSDAVPDAVSHLKHASNESLCTASQLIRAAERRLQLRCKALPKDDPLLGGAYAALDRREQRIWYAGGGSLSMPLRNLILAHEFGHALLHPDLEEDRFTPDQVLTLDFGEEGGNEDETTLLGYSPAERREAEANVFAAEMLLPCDVARMLYAEKEWTATQIAAAIGITEASVHDQLIQALLVPERVDAAASEKNSPSVSSLQLDASQRRAAETEQGPILVDAGPGTGKTRTLIARILHLIRDRGILPEGILALTFSNRAAEEMRERLRSAIGDEADRVWIGTFHAFGYELLRKEGGVLGLPARPALMELVDAVALLQRHLPLLNLREYEYLHQPGLPFPDILSCISRAKDELKTPEMYRLAAEEQLAIAVLGNVEADVFAARKALEVATIYTVYQQALEALGMLDFGDLLMRAVELLDRFPAVRRRLQSQYPHVLADEYQDINRASAQLLQRLAGTGQGFWAVGDLRQSIYQFRGASPANVTRFEQDFPGGKRLRLDVNYRSRPHLVRLFGDVATAAFSSDKLQTLWKAYRERAVTPMLSAGIAEDEAAQAAGIADRIVASKNEGYALEDQVVLCATNAQAEEMASRLEGHGICVQYLGGLLERSEVKDLLALLSLASESHGNGLARVGCFPEYGIPWEDVETLWQAAGEREVNFPAALKPGPELALSVAGQEGLSRLWRDLEGILYRGDAATFLARYLFEVRGYLPALLQDSSVSGRLKRLAIHQLLHLARRSAHRDRADSPRERQAGFLSYLRALLQCGEGNTLRMPADSSAGGGVRLMTIHQSKGLEFPVVYLPNLNEGQLPFRRAGKMATPPKGLFELGGDDALREDARKDDEGEESASADACLFFVALTRAQDHLVLSRMEKRRGKPTRPSKLLSLLDAISSEIAMTWERWDRIEVEERVGAGKIGEMTAYESTEILSPGDIPSVTLSALDMYRECPRRYYYRHVAHLPETQRESAYRVFHEAMTEVQRWIQEEHRLGRQPTIDETKEQFCRRQSARELAADESGWAELLRRRGEELVGTVVAAASSMEQAATLQDYALTADLPNGRIRMRVDSAAMGVEGTLHLERIHRRGVKRDDHTDERLALWRFAAKQEDPQREVEIALYYLATGEKRSVAPSGRYEPARVERYDKALKGIRLGEFEARPDDAKCAQCPFLFLCPS